MLSNLLLLSLVLVTKHKVYLINRVIFRFLQVLVKGVYELPSKFLLYVIECIIVFKLIFSILFSVNTIDINIVH